ncbi:MAG: TlpA disulfide reductase family protein [Nitrospinales bacterium]
MKSTVSKKKNSIPIKKYIGLFAFLFVLALVYLFAHLNEDPLALDDLGETSKFAEEKSAVGYKAPGFSLKNLNGQWEMLEDYNGQVVILNFWATWCAPCRVEMPSFETLYRRYRSEGLTVLAVSFDKAGEGKVRKFVENYKLSFPILMDTEGEVEKLYPSFSIPSTYVIDKSGWVVAKVDGAKNWQSRETFEAVEFLLKQP